jgi:ATP-dependent helicase HrpA
MRHEAAGASSDKFPAGFEVLGQKLKLTYLHQPNDAEDGVTLTVPLAMLNQVPLARCEWLVPGLLEEKVTALLKTVPQKHRHRLQPIGQSAKEFIEAAEEGEFSREDGLVRALQKYVEDKVSLKLPQESFRLENLNPHCFMNFRVIDEHGRVLGMSRNLPELRTRLRDQVQAAFKSAQVPGSLGAQLAALKVGGRTDASGDVDQATAAKGNPPPRAGEGRVGADRSAEEASGMPPPHEQSRPAASPLGRRGAVLPETPPSPPARGGGSKDGGARADGGRGAARADAAAGVARGSAGGASAHVESASAAPMSGFTAWTFGELPELLEVKVAGRTVIGFPALQDDGDSVSITAVDTEEEAARVHRRGLARLFALTLKDQVKAIEKLPGLRELALQFMPFGTDTELKVQLVAATLERTCLMDPLPANADAFAQRTQDAKARISLVAQELMRLAGTLVAEHASLTKRFVTLKQSPDVLADLQQQLSKLMPKNFLLAYPFEKLSQFPRYLKAIGVRIDKLRNNPARDAQLMTEWKSLAQPFEREQIAKAKAGVIDPQLEEFRWMLEELRVGLFAQELKTPMPVSTKRLQKIWDSRPR